MSLRSILAALFAALSLVGVANSPAFAVSTETAGTDVAVLMPLIAGGVTLWKGDWTGTAEPGADPVAPVGAAYGLKHVIKEKRPDGSDYESFPSDTAAVAFAPAQFLWDR